MPQTIDSIDRFFLTLFNGSHSMFLDEFALLFTNTVAWVPLFIALIILVVKNNEKTSQVMLLLGAFALGFLLSDGLADGIVKPLVGRLRPVNDPSMASVVNVVNGYHPSGYSFFSAHAANTFALAMLLTLIIRNTTFSTFMFLWAVGNCWTRLYLGAHYMSDIVVGIVWGCCAGAIAYAVYRRLYYKVSPRLHFISSQYTRSGYSLADIDMVLSVLVLTVVVLIMLSCLWAR